MTAEHNTTSEAGTQSDAPQVQARALLRRHGITVMHVVRALGGGANYRSVYRALDPAKAGRVDPGLTKRVRAGVEAALRAHGWSGTPEALWAGFPAPGEGRRGNGARLDGSTHVRRLMHRYGITRASIAREVDTSTTTVYDVLHPVRAFSVAHGATVHVRARIEARLREAGWQGSAAELWADYDGPVQQAA